MSPRCAGQHLHVPALPLAVAAPWCAPNRGASAGRAGGQPPQPSSLPAKSHSRSHFSPPFLPPRPALAFVSARGRGSAGYPHSPVPTLIIRGSQETQRSCRAAGSRGGGRRGGGHSRLRRRLSFSLGTTFNFLPANPSL